MTERERNENGQFEQAVDDEEILAAVREHAPAATSEVAEAVGVSRQAADYRLRQLHSGGEVEKKKIAASLVWTPSEPADGAGQDGSPDGVGGEVYDPVEDLGGEPAQADAQGPADTVDLEGSGSRLEARRRALGAIVEHLREHDSATAGELKEIADEYDHGYADADAYWANMRRQDALDKLPIETPGRGGKEYRYQPE